MTITNFDACKIDDFIADNQHEMLRLKMIIENKIDFPHSKTAILLHGTYGAGKTQLARMIPRELERHRVGDFDEKSFDEFGYIFKSCASSGGNELIRDTQMTSASFHKSRLHYVVLDEVDNLRVDVQKNMRSFMTENENVIYIMTTNQIMKIDDGIKSRSHCISFEKPCETRWRQKCRTIVDEYKINLDDDEITKIVSLANGDARSIRATLEEYLFLNAT
jgi:DNA polymerase III delta prime subunit